MAANVTVKVDSVIRYPVLRDANDSALDTAFKAELFSTPTNWAVIGTEFLTVHLTVDIWGVTYTPAADTQVTAFGFTPAQKFVLPMNNSNAFGIGVGASVLTTPASVYPMGF
jgi:hypothetical protein